MKDTTTEKYPKEWLVILAIAAAMPILYSLYTNHIWEDFFITFRHSQNLCEGKGLLFNAEERVHGFTSPIGVLLPALCYWLTGKNSYIPALWLFRIFSSIAFAGGCLFLLRCCHERISRLFLAVFYCLEAKSIAFSANGMETAFMLLFVAWGIYLIHNSQKQNWLAWGVCWGGLMWTRPDGCVYIAVFVIVQLVFGEKSWRQKVIENLNSAGICTLIYLPWFIWAWSYYGSPMPHTIIAKSNTNGHLHHLQQVLNNLYWLLPERMALVFMPSYAEFGDWPYWITFFSYILGTFAACLWIFPQTRKEIRAISLAFFLLCIYLCYIPRAAPWYLPPIALCALVVIARGFPIWHSKVCKMVAIACYIAVTAALVCLLELTAVQIDIQQREIEFGNRRQIGLWLRDNIEPGDTVYLETLGYIGYFSGAKMIDYPGLVSPQVVYLRRQKQLDFLHIIREIQPSWLVLRPAEMYPITNDAELQKFFSDNYSVVKTFDARERLKEYDFIPGEAYLHFDSVFMVLHKKDK